MFSIQEVVSKLIGRKHGLKVNSLHKFKKNCFVKVELPCRLGGITVESRELTIGAHTYIRSNTECLHVSEIGRYCSVGRNVILGQDPRNHPVNWVTTSPVYSKQYHSPTRPLKIGHDVWIGHRATIMSGITIGHGAIIGCDSVVTKNVEPYAIVAGNPAKLIRYRFDEQITQKLLKIKWWNAPYEHLSQLNFCDIEKFLTEFKPVFEFKPKIMKISGKNVRMHRNT